MKKGFSLIELLVFISVLSVFFIAALSVSVYFLRNFKEQQYKIVASHLLEEGIEWVKFKKELDWNDFYLKRSSNGNIYCLNNLDLNIQGTCSSFDLGSPNFFKRELIIKTIESYKVEVSIYVYWPDFNGENKINSKIILAITE